jgi:hypothetical protein
LINHTPLSNSLKHHGLAANFLPMEIWPMLPTVLMISMILSSHQIFHDSTNA